VLGNSISGFQSDAAELTARCRHHQLADSREVKPDPSRRSVISLTSLVSLKVLPLTSFAPFVFKGRRQQLGGAVCSAIYQELHR